MLNINAPLVLDIHDIVCTVEAEVKCDGRVIAGCAWDVSEARRSWCCCETGGGEVGRCSRRVSDVERVYGVGGVGISAHLEGADAKASGEVSLLAGDHGCRGRAKGEEGGEYLLGGKHYEYGLDGDVKELLKGC